jgi:alginate O-acetyltransferase complex protein AlgI
MSSISILFALSLVFSLARHFSQRVSESDTILLTFNLTFLLLILERGALLYLGLFLTISYLILLTARRFSKVPFSLCVLSIVLLFAIFKKYQFLPIELLTSVIPDIAGLSFVIFRVIALLFEAKDRRNVPAITEYLNYTISMFTFVSGPIQRYSRFTDDQRRRKTFVLDDDVLLACLNRVFSGAIKVTLIGPVVQGLQLSLWESLPSASLTVVQRISTAAHYGLACIAFLVFLYFNFSGYTDIVIGLGRMIGFNLPENFDHPLRSTSFLDFWNRWHISLSTWFRDYCFTPVLKKMITLRIRNVVIATAPAYFISFGLIGIWHGRTWPFLLCGMMFAFAAVVNHSYHVLFTKSACPPFHRIVASKRLRASISSSLTLIYISIAISGLWMPGAAISAVWASFTLASGLVGFSLIAVLMTFALYLARTFQERPACARIWERLVYLLEGCRPTGLVAAKLFLVLCWCFTASSNLPDIVYRVF